MTQDQLDLLKTTFPMEALSADTSRGFELTSIKAAFVIERLNEVFGPCGTGWRYVHASFEWVEGEMTTEVALRYADADSTAGAVVWNLRSEDWQFLPDTSAWSWPIFAAGGKKVGKGSVPFTDARKGAVTDGLTKAASMLGIGHEVFKGLVRVGQGQRPNTQRETSEPEPSLESLPSNAQAFWKLANKAIDAGISHERIRTIAASANGEGWSGAMATLQVEMEKVG